MKQIYAAPKVRGAIDSFKVPQIEKRRLRDFQVIILTQRSDSVDQKIVEKVLAGLDGLCKRPVIFDCEAPVFDGYRRIEDALVYARNSDLAIITFYEGKSALAGALIRKLREGKPEMKIVLISHNDQAQRYMADLVMCASEVYFRPGWEVVSKIENSL